MVPGAQYSATHGRRRDQGARHKRDPDPRHLCLHDAERASRKVVFYDRNVSCDLIPLSNEARGSSATPRLGLVVEVVIPAGPSLVKGKLRPWAPLQKGTQLQCDAAFSRLVLTLVYP